MKRIITPAFALLFVGVLSAVGACSMDVDDDVTPREIYEVHADLETDAAIELFKTCPGLTRVRALTAPQIAGVDIRVEFSDFGSHKLAACVDAYLAEHGSKKFETDTYFPQYGSSGGGSTG